VLTELGISGTKKAKAKCLSLGARAIASGVLATSAI